MSWETNLSVPIRAKPSFMLPGFERRAKMLQCICLGENSQGAAWLKYTLSLKQEYPIFAGPKFS